MMAVPDVIRECMMVTMLFFKQLETTKGHIGHKILGRSLQLCSVADQQFIQFCKSVKQASCLAGAGAWQILVDRPFLPGGCSNDAWVLSQRLRPRLGLCFGQHEDGGWAFCNSTQRCCQCSFLRRFRGQPRHRGRFGRPPRKCGQIYVT